MKHDPAISASVEQQSDAEARALADYRAGRYWDHAIVSEWLKTWGKPDRRSFQDWLTERDG